MQVETFELADLAKTRTTELCDDSDNCTRGRKVALAWVADMLQDGWEIWDPRHPEYYRVRLARFCGDENRLTGVGGVFVEQHGLEEVFFYEDLLSALDRMASSGGDASEYFDYEGLEQMLEALEYGNTVPFRKYLHKIAS